MDDAGPSSLATQQFDAWGQLQAAVGAIATYGYTGREPDASGLVHYRARYYNPSQGRFVSRDPIGLAGGINPYAYADGNPANHVDPTGLTPVSPLQLPQTTSYPSYDVAQATQLRTMVLTDAGPMCSSCGPVGGGYQLNAAGDLVPAQRPPSVGERLWNTLVRPSVDGLSTLLTTPGKAWENFQDNVFGGRIFNGGANSEEGCIYCVKGDKTSSGKDYVGSTDNMGNRQRDKSDGRDRQGAEVVDTYPKGDRDARRTKEQQAINDRGGVDKLDNRRNEVAPRNWPDKGITPP